MSLKYEPVSEPLHISVGPAGGQTIGGVQPRGGQIGSQNVGQSSSRRSGQTSGQIVQGVFACDHAGLIINKLCRHGAGADAGTGRGVLVHVRQRSQPVIGVG